MPTPVKVSDRLLALAKAEARGTHRSATAQIEHWATLGRAVEALLAYREVLALKRAGQALPVPAFVEPDAIRELLVGLVDNPDREEVKARIRSAGTPLYTIDPDRPGTIVEIQSDGTRLPHDIRDRHRPAAKGRPAPRRA
ncbi:MAG TPA: hypothetical protein VNO23_00805 [Candidatus Binatia bacterium]|nr:hypothetical protein [Candidatus Binatia bacterium]